MRELFPVSLPDHWGKTWRFLRSTAVICVLGSLAWYFAGQARGLWSNFRSKPAQAALLPDPAQQITQEITGARDAAQYARALQLAADGQTKYPGTARIRDIADDLQRDFTVDWSMSCVRLANR
jgi:hypothetical protein